MSDDHLAGYRPRHSSLLRAALADRDDASGPPANATVREPITIHYCGPPGSSSATRRLEPGTRVLITELRPSGLARIVYPGSSDRGALVDGRRVIADATATIPEPCSRDASSSHARSTPKRADSSPSARSTSDGSGSTTTPTAPPAPAASRPSPSPSATRSPGSETSATDADALLDDFLVGNPVTVAALPALKELCSRDDIDPALLEIQLDENAGTARLITIRSAA